MTATVLVGNLPPGTTEQELLDELTGNGWPDVSVIKVDAGNPDKLLFTVETSLDPQIARSMSERYGNRSTYKGRRLDLYVPLTQK